MPDSIRELLQGIAGDEPGPSQDLAAGAFKRARDITRRRYAAGAIGVVIALALAGMGTASLLNPDEGPGPADDPTTAAESPTDEDETDDQTDFSSEGCAGLGDWTGWGSSNSAAELTELPTDLYFAVQQDGAESFPAIYRYEGDAAESLLDDPDDSYFMAPDGNRFAIGSPSGDCSSLATMTGDKVDDVGVYTMYCKPSWSPDSDRVVLNAADPELHAAYLVDFTTGELTDVPEEVGCSPRWSADGEYLVSADGTVAMRPDGTGRTELAGAAAWTEDEEFTGLASVSADLSRACLQFDDAETAQSGHATANRCDRYVDTETGDELDLPVEVQNPQVVFLADGSMIVVDDQYGTIVVSLVGADGSVLDERELPAQGSGGSFLRGYFTAP